jgi:hypothetical protein
VLAAKVVDLVAEAESAMSAAAAGGHQWRPARSELA